METGVAMPKGKGMDESRAEPPKAHWSVQPLTVMIVAVLGFYIINILNSIELVLLNAVWARPSLQFQTLQYLPGVIASFVSLALSLLFTIYVLKKQQAHGLNASTFRFGRSLWVGIGLCAVYLLLATLQSFQFTTNAAYWPLYELSYVTNLMTSFQLLFCVSIVLPAAQPKYGYGKSLLILCTMVFLLQLFDGMFGLARLLLLQRPADIGQTLSALAFRIPSIITFYSLAAVLLQAANRKVPGSALLYAGAIRIIFFLVGYIQFNSSNIVWFWKLLVPLPAYLLVAFACFAILRYMDRGGELKQLSSHLFSFLKELRSKSGN